MYKKVICVFLSLIILFVTGCSNKGKYSVGYDIVTDPVNLDPQSASDQASLMVINNIFEGLYRVDEDNGLSEAVVKDCTISNDGLKYTFTLREDVKWKHEDNPYVTAYDFVFAFKRLALPSTNSPDANLFFCIRNFEDINKNKKDVDSIGVYALDDTTLVFELEYQNSDFLSLLSLPSTMPCNEDFFVQTNGRYGLESETVTSNGPFEISKWDHEEYVRLKRSETYYNIDEVMPGTVTLYIEPKDPIEQRLDDDVTQAAILDGSRYENIVAKGYGFDKIENRSYTFCFNLKKESLKNKNLRLAIAYATDRSIINDLIGNKYSVSGGLIPSGATFSGINYRQNVLESVLIEYSATEAQTYYKKALSELDVSSVKGLKILVDENNQDIIEMCTYISQIYQRDLNLFVSIDAVDTKTYNQRKNSMDYDILLNDFDNGNNTPLGILSNFISDNGNNFLGYSDVNFDNIVKKATLAASTKEAIEGYSQAEKHLIDSGAIIPIVLGNDYFVTGKNTKGINYNQRTGLIDFMKAEVN